MDTSTPPESSMKEASTGGSRYMAMVVLAPMDSLPCEVWDSSSMS